MRGGELRGPGGIIKEEEERGGSMTIGDKLVPIDRNLRNLILEGLFIQGLMLRYPPILAGKRGFY